MEILLILHQKHFDQLFLFFDDVLTNFEHIFDQPLSIAPDSVRLWIRLNQFSCQFDLPSKQLPNLFRSCLVNSLLNKLSPKVEDSGYI